MIDELHHPIVVRAPPVNPSASQTVVKLPVSLRHSGRNTVHHHLTIGWLQLPVAAHAPRERPTRFTQIQPAKDIDHLFTRSLSTHVDTMREIAMHQQLAVASQQDTALDARDSHHLAVW